VSDERRSQPGWIGRAPARVIFERRPSTIKFWRTEPISIDDGGTTLKTVMVVDDSPSVRRQVCMALAPAGYTLVEASDGIEAISKLENADVSLIICDINMPRMNGLDLVEKVKSSPAYAKLPVLMLTSEGQPTLIHRAKKAGARGWIVKPFKPDMLAAAVQSLLKPNVATAVPDTRQ
jgi:two-component system chemotaxis response regulator CheY